MSVSRSFEGVAEQKLVDIFASDVKSVLSNFQDEKKRNFFARYSINAYEDSDDDDEQDNKAPSVIAL